MRATAVVFALAASAVIAAVSYAGAAAWSMAGALLILYTGGYVAGALLVRRVDGETALAWAVIRTGAGLLLTTIGFLLSLSLALPWMLLPVALVALALRIRGMEALSWPNVSLHWRWDGVAAGVLAGLLLSPIVVSALWMAPGSFPPVFYNVDTAYFLEKVHALVAASSYPPDSLSNAGGVRTYHFGTHAMAALVSRGSGLAPHQALFLVVMPLLVASLVAAAVAAARYVAPALPRCVAVPLLLVTTPSLAVSFWDSVAPQLWATVSSARITLDGLIGDVRIWGFLSNEAQNVGGDFLILAAIAGIAAAPSLGWALPVFVIGTAVLFKSPTGVALLAGFLMLEAWRSVVARRLRVSPQMVAVAAVFVGTFAVFWLWPAVEPEYRTESYPFFHLRWVAERGTLTGLGFDLLWLLLPAGIVVVARLRDPEARSAPLLAMAVAPLLLVNGTRLVDVRPDGGVTDDEWLQVLHAVPFLLHAFVLSLASARWRRLGGGIRVAILAVLLLAVLPVVTAAGRYSFTLVRDPESGHEFVDNRALAEALAVIPTTGSMIVTNDLRYPAQRFTRDERQMQVPALFGHQAFAVNYAYERFSFSAERRDLQRLLQAAEWSDAILDAAHAYGWTHLLVRKDYVHPAPIPLERIFDGPFYAVYRFPPLADEPTSPFASARSPRDPSG